MELLTVGAAVVASVGAWLISIDLFNDGIQNKRKAENFVPSRTRRGQSANILRNDKISPHYEFWNTVDKGVPSSYNAFMEAEKDKSQDPPHRRNTLGSRDSVSRQQLGSAAASYV